MSWVDVGILAIIGLSAVFSLMRGFVKEALSLGAWLAAFWVGLTFAHRLAALEVLARRIHSDSARGLVAFLILFLLTLLVGALINYLVSQLIKKSGLSGTDRMLGIVFGVARGVLLVSILVLLAGLMDLPKEWWADSVLMKQFQTIAVWISGFLPPTMAHSFPLH